MWKPSRKLRCDWCSPRKVVNLYAGQPSDETIVESKKRRKAKSSLKIKRNRRIKKAVKGARCVRRYTRSDIFPRFSQQRQEPIVPGKVKKRALLARASKRVKELALPKNVTPLNIDLKRECDPFKVRPSALTAICSPRTKMLAKPKYSDNFFDESCNIVAKLC